MTHLHPKVLVWVCPGMFNLSTNNQTNKFCCVGYSVQANLAKPQGSYASLMKLTAVSNCLGLEKKTEDQYL